MGRSGQQAAVSVVRGHDPDCGFPFGFGFGVRTRKSPALRGAGFLRVGEMIRLFLPSAGIDGGRLLGDDATGLAVLAGQAFADETTRESRHRNAFSLGLVVEPRDQVVFEPGRVSPGESHGESPSVEVNCWGRPWSPSGGKAADGYNPPIVFWTHSVGKRPWAPVEDLHFSPSPNGPRNFSGTIMALSLSRSAVSALLVSPSSLREPAIGLEPMTC